MSSVVRAAGFTSRSPALKLHVPAEELANSARWLINGFPATILVWTAEEWARLLERPNDAQPFPNGSWCALRMD
jgi:hypothetical protein